MRHEDDVANPLLQPPLGLGFPNRVCLVTCPLWVWLKEGGWGTQKLVSNLVARAIRNAIRTNRFAQILHN